ncbi:hypothetical protein Ancab_028145 [Ancistrocladus abbreviatus]
MADTIISYLLETVGDLLKQEITTLLGAKNDIKDLASQLDVINAFLRDSEGKRDENQVVRELMRQIRDVAQEAEDVIEDFMLDAEKQRRKNVFRKIFHSPNQVANLHSVAEKTREINKTITNIYNNFQLYGISMNVGGESSDPAHPSLKASEAVQRRRRDVEKDIVGRRDEVGNITTKLITGSAKLDFVSIIGMGGLGKTTIAKQIYDDENISKHFDCRGWVFVSEEYDTRQVVLGLVKSVMPERAPEALEQKTEGELKVMLYDHLRFQSYLVVLDDIWKPELWDEISQCFPLPEGKKCSRIMITSRNKKVADRVCPDSDLALRPLEYPDDWDLFSKKVFRGQPPCHPIIEELGREIVKKCKGLPLSIVVMAGILAGEKSVNKWERTRDSVNPILAEDKISTAILALSYHDLRREVKPCFLYFAAFPEDFEVPARQLIRLWVGEGLIQKSRERTMEDVAEDYLENLIDRSLVQAEKFRMDGGVKTCRIHDMLRELCIAEAAEENFLASQKEVNPSTSSTSNPRRLSVQCNVPNFILRNSSKLKYVRSIQSFDRGYTSRVAKMHWKAVSEGKLLRVLDFGSVRVEEVPDEAGDLLNLRYLKINAPSLRQFPSSLLSLRSLRTLDMRSTKLSNVPKEIYKMQNLQHLFLSGAVKFPKPSSNPSDLEWSLQTLSTVAPGQGIATIIENGVFASMKRLGLCDSSKEADWRLLSDLHKLQNLESLKIASKIDNSIILTNMKSSWFPASLIKVTLRCTKLDSTQFEIFGKLPNLRILKICNTWSNLMFRGESFPKLQVLYMASVTVESWELMEGASPGLEHLMFDNCGFSCELPHKALADLAYLKDIRAKRPYGSLKDSLEILKHMVDLGKCSIVILP